MKSNYENPEQGFNQTKIGLKQLNRPLHVDGAAKGFNQTKIGLKQKS